MQRRIEFEARGQAEACPSGGTRFRASRLAPAGFFVAGARVKRLGLIFLFCLTTDLARGQNAIRLPEQERKVKEQKVAAKQQEKMAQRANLEIRGNTAFNDKELRSQLKEQLSTIEDYGLTTARADDAAFFLELFYKKHGYAKVEVHYAIVSGDRFRLEINEGPLVHLGRAE